ncbi:MAG: hypothetical protein V3V00_16035 [Saprospiraceae bacterium]
MSYTVVNSKANCNVLQIEENLDPITGLPKPVPGRMLAIVPGLQIISDEDHALLTVPKNEGKGLSNGQRFFKEKVDNHIYDVNKIKSSSLDNDPVSIIVGMNKPAAIKAISEINERKIIKGIIEDDKRKEVVVAAKERMKIINPLDR